MSDRAGLARYLCYYYTLGLFSEFLSVCSPLLLSNALLVNPPFLCVLLYIPNTTQFLRAYQMLATN